MTESVSQDSLGKVGDLQGGAPPQETSLGFGHRAKAHGRGKGSGRHSWLCSLGSANHSLQAPSVPGGILGAGNTGVSVGKPDPRKTPTEIIGIGPDEPSAPSAFTVVAAKGIRIAILC